MATFAALVGFRGPADHNGAVEVGYVLLQERARMDYAAAIERVYDHLENDHVDKAVMTCLRIARNLQDYLYAAIFLREMYADKREVIRVLYDDTSHLKQEAIKLIYASISDRAFASTLAMCLSRSKLGWRINMDSIIASQE